MELQVGKSYRVLKDIFNFKTKESMTINEFLDKSVWQRIGEELLFCTCVPRCPPFLLG